ncbi:hypothetical protein ACWGDE_10070 [Streptomyces sp. NPDC054956]
MCASIYRVLDTQMLLREDGTPIWELADNDEIFDLSEAPESVGAAYMGRRIRQLAQFRSESLPYYEEPSYKALKEAGELVGFGATVLSLVEDLNKWASNLPPATDPAIRLLNQLNAKLREIHDFQLAAWVTEREQSLADLNAYAQTAIGSARDFAQALLTEVDPLGDPYYADVIHSAEHDSSVVVKQLMQPAFWMRPESTAAISTKGDPVPYPTGWMANMPDRAGTDEWNRVWDHRWALPALLYAIAARVIVLKARYAADLSVIPKVRQELEGYIEYLGNVWKRMDSGIRRGLEYADWTHRQRSDFSNKGWVPAFVVDLNGAEWIGGVADVYSLDEDDFAYWWNGPKPPAGEIANLGGTFEQQAAKFIHQVQAWGYSYVADAIGCHELMMFIGELWNIHDGNYRSLPFSNWQRLISDIISDADRRKDALIASLLSDRNPAPQAGRKESNAFYIYNALRSDRGEASKAIEQCAEDLIRIGRAKPPFRHSEGAPLP